MIVAGGLAIGLRPMSDNSFLTHLATGRFILEHDRVPTTDVYAFTADGAEWVVQSWLVSAALATAEGVGGMVLVRWVVGIVSAAVAAVAWRLTGPAHGIGGRLGIAILFLLVGSGQWAERPFMVGLLCFGLTMLAAEEQIDPRWLVPIGWVWVNSHGSFPLGLVYLVISGTGRWLDRGEWQVERRCVAWAATGLLLGIIGPLGARALTFPAALLTRHSLLQHVVEWQAPTFTSLGQRTFLVQLVLAIVLLARRPSQRSALLVGAFVALALVSSRNITLASLVLLPVLADGLRGVGEITSDQRPRMARAVAAVGVVLVVLVAVARSKDPALVLDRYPIDGLAFLDERGVDLEEQRLAAPDIVGNLIGLVYGEGERVFYDDRFDMFPSSASDAHLALVRATPDLRVRLDEHQIALALVELDSPAARALTADPGWRTVFSDEEWIVTCRRGERFGHHAC